METQNQTFANPATLPVSVAETATALMAAQAKALVEARYVVAINRPRDIFDVEQKLLKECKRPGFANTARYVKPVDTRKGIKVSGPSIRFAETAIRLFSNINTDIAILFDNDEKRIIRVSITDLETNTFYSQDIILAKTVERLFVKDGQKVLSSRQNSNGVLTYLVQASEDELLIKQNAQISKAIRNQGLRLIPADIIEECMTEVVKTQSNANAKDPDLAKKNLVASFANLGISAAMLTDYLGHSLENLLPEEREDLIAIGTAIKDGETSWKAIMESKKADVVEENKSVAEQPAKPKPAKNDLAALVESKTIPTTPITSTAPVQAPYRSKNSRIQQLPTREQETRFVFESKFKKIVARENEDTISIWLGTNGYESLADVPPGQFLILLNEAEKYFLGSKSSAKSNNEEEF